MKDKTIFLLIPLFLILAILLGIVFYDNYNTNATNEKLKKEIYKIRKKCNKLEEEKLKLMIGGDYSEKN